MRVGQISRAFVCIACLLGAAPRLSLGVITYYTSRGGFNTANPGLPVETFEAGAVAPGSFAQFTGPLNATTSNGSFQPGAIRPGISLSDFAGPGPGEMVLLGAGTLPGISKGILAFVYLDGLAVDFTPGVRSVAADVASSSGLGVTGSEPIVVKVYGQGGLLDTRTISGAGVRFLGLSSNADTITRIEIADLTGITSEYIDNFTFGTVPEPAAGVVILSAVVILVRRKRS